MENESAVAEATPAVVNSPESTLSFEIPRSGTPDYDSWRNDGKLPADKPVKEESAPSKQTTKADADESPTSNTPQERSERDKAKAAKRFQDLLAERDVLRAENASLKAPKDESKPKPEQKQPQLTSEAEPTPEDTNADGTPKFATYEAFTKALARYEARQERAEWEQRQHADAQAKAFNAKVEESRGRYENFDEVVRPAATAINGDAAIPQGIKDLLNRSDLLPDILFTIGGDQDTLDNFVKTAKEDPFAAAEYIAGVKRLIREKLGKTSADARNDKGQFVKTEAEKPAKRGPESAAAPPLEVGTRGSGTMDEGERALKAIEGGDARAVSAWMDAQNRKDMDRRNGR